jgi:hypothetical protein
MIPYPKCYAYNDLDPRLWPENGSRTQHKAFYRNLLLTVKNNNYLKIFVYYLIFKFIKKPTSVLLLFDIHEIEVTSANTGIMWTNFQKVPLSK